MRDRSSSMPARWASLAMFVGLTWAYFLVLGAVAYLAGLRHGAPAVVGFAVSIAVWLAAYALAVRSVAWWRQRQGDA